MKKIVAVTFLILLVILLFTCLWRIPNNNNVESKNVADSTTTILRIKNSNPTQTITVYLTLSCGAGWVSDVNGMFGIVSSKKSQGSFILNPNDSLDYITPDSLGLSGNFSFGYPPVNCPVGITLYEFTLNNAGTIKFSQETTEISCVAGVSSLGKITLYGGGNWEANPNYMNVRFIKNDSMGKNSGLVGVFPYGCTNCTDTAGKPDCITNPEKPQSQAICNISRDANNSGGIVKVEFIGLINN
ncbi:MAG TPA: hypothetical protein VN026_11485 [Bacteroidia bacterium]|jgi:hypothetical protein|nr:hypothetical protein [Bacteroidia bacterium]